VILPNDDYGLRSCVIDCRRETCGTEVPDRTHESQCSSMT